MFAGAPDGKLLVEKTSNYFENEEALERLRSVVPAHTLGVAAKSAAYFAGDVAAGVSAGPPAASAR